MCSCFCPSSRSPWRSFVICTGSVIGFLTRRQWRCTPQSTDFSSHAPHTIPRLSPLLSPLDGCGAAGSTCAPLARGEKPPGSTQAGKHKGLRLSSSPVPVLRHHRRSHSCARWGWQAWPCRAHPTSARPCLPSHVHCPASYPFVPLENTLSCRVAVVLTALASWAGSFQSSAGLRLPASHYHEPFCRVRARTLRLCISTRISQPPIPSPAGGRTANKATQLHTGAVAVAGNRPPHEEYSCPPPGSTYAKHRAHGHPLPAADPGRLSASRSSRAMA